MNKYKTITKISIIILFIGTIILASTFLTADHRTNKNSTPKILNTTSSESLNNANIIEQILDTQVDHYANKSYFPSDYTPSLQGTYYTLSILSTLNRLDAINHTKLLDFIMDHYNTSSGLFMDEYAHRYLDTDYNLEFYPLSSVLQVNAYALLSLHLLGRVYLLDFQKMVDFIWECYNPSSGGFAGHPFESAPSKYFRAATLDNTYYAVISLDLLLDSWAGYSSEKTAIIDFVTGSQELTPNSDHYGGFYVDPENHYPYLDYANPSLLSAYYALKVLDLFSMGDLIDTAAFHSYLDLLYQAEEIYFKIAHLSSFPNQSIFTATALGLELSLLTDYSAIEESEITTFLLDNRNERGLWDVTDSYGFYELFDSFEVIRSLSNTGYINELGTSGKNSITSAMKLFRSYRGFSFFSHEYTKTSQIHSIAESFRMYDRVGDLEILELYYDLEEAYWEGLHLDTRVFRGYINTNGEYSRFKLDPIEFDSLGTKAHINHIDYPSSHKWTYKTLRALNKLYKLDDFDNYHNLTELLNSAIECQITDTESEKFGGFVPYDRIKLYSSPEKFVDFDHAYYAIKTIEFLTEWLGIGNISDTSVDTDALYVYLSPFIVETPHVLYCEPEYITATDIELRLEHTYYLAELFALLEYPSLDAHKIKNFVLNSINYENIKNLYYCFKLDEMFSLNIEFNLKLTHQLIKDIYEPSTGKLYLTPKHHRIDYNAMYWLCYMAHHDIYRIKVDYPSLVPLTTEFNFSTCISNIILDTIDIYHTLKFESDLLGSHTLTDPEDGVYTFQADIPLNPNLYPVVEGEINLYEGPNVIISYPISFDTVYGLQYEVSRVNRTAFQEFNIIAKFNTPTGLYELENGEAYIKTYVNGTLLHDTTLDNTKCGTYSNFSKVLSLQDYGDYHFDVYLADGVNNSFRNIGTYAYEYTPPEVPRKSDQLPSGVRFPGYIIALGGLASLSLLSYGLLQWDKQLMREENERAHKKEVEKESTEVTYDILTKMGDGETLWKHKRNEPS